MNISPAGVAFIKAHEGCVLHVYNDAAGIPTIGWGHARWTGESPITQAQADALLVGDLRPCEAAVNSLVDVPLAQNEFDALCSFVFNCGAGAFATSSARRALNEGDRRGAAVALLLWDKVRDPKSGQLVTNAGLFARRLDEATLFYGRDPREPQPEAA